jgi:hypothetical protein
MFIKTIELRDFQIHRIMIDCYSKGSKSEK